MSDVPRLLDRFERGQLVRPARGRPGTVDLIRALFRLCGADLPAGEHVLALKRELGRHAHYLFVLVDGLGSDVAKRFSRGGFFTRRFRCDLEPVFPSTTAAAITSLATAAHPARHAVPGWWTRLPDHGVTATILPFVERFGGADLRDHGVEPGHAYPVPSLLPRLAHRAASILPADIAGSVYSDYFSGGGPRLAFDSPEHAFDLARRRIGEAAGPTFTWLYLPDLDGRAHVHGPDSDPVAAELLRYESLLDGLARDLAGAARIVVTADHGLAEVPDGARHVLEEADPLLALLVAPPSGEPVVPVFHAREGMADGFAREFRRRFGDAFALLATDEVERLGLLGPGPLSPPTRARLGDFLAVALEPAVLLYAGDPHSPSGFRGFHAGLSPPEMSVPLLLA